MERILISINVRWWNAEAAYALNLAQGLSQAGHQVWVLANPDSPPAQKAKALGLPLITHILLDRYSLKAQWNNYQALLTLIQDLDLTVLHSFKSNGSHLFGFARRRYPGLIHVRTRGEARPPQAHFLNRWLYGSALTDGIFAAGKKVEGWLEKLRLKNQLITLAYYAMPPLPPKQSPTPNPLGLPEGSNLIALLGRAQPVKGHAVLLEAFARLHRPEAHLLFLVKDPHEFPQVMAELERKIEALNIKEQVHWAGFQTDLNPWLDATDLAVIPSLDSEINCRAACEWMNKGVPLVVFPTGSLPEIIVHRHSGYICAGQEAADLTAGLNWFLTQPERLRSCGQKGQEAFFAHYQIQKLAQLCLHFYQEARKKGAKILHNYITMT